MSPTCTLVTQAPEIGNSFGEGTTATHTQQILPSPHRDNSASQKVTLCGFLLVGQREVLLVVISSREWETLPANEMTSPFAHKNTKSGV